MKQLLLFLFISIGYHSYSQLQATIDIKKFNSTSGPYIEAYLSVNAASITFAKDESGVDKCKVEILEIVKKDNEIINYKKVVLENSTSTQEEIYADLLHQERFILGNGEYSFEIELKDLTKDSAKVVKHSESITINFKDDEISISDIELLDSFWKTDKNSATAKSGYEMIPLVSDYFAPSFEKIAYYFEVYNADKVLGQEGKYVLQHFIESYENGNIVGNNNKISKQDAKLISATLNAFDITDLASGNYNLVVQIKDQNNFVIAEQKQRFQRLNAVQNIDLNNVSTKGTFVEQLNKDSLDEFIYSLRPISSAIEYNMVDNQLEKMNDSLKIQYFYNFWHSRDPLTTERSWLDYKKHVEEVEVMFGTQIKAGYETDRGRIFLQYGAPNSVKDRANEPNSYPYQIWHYYKIGQFNNIRFVFYLPDLVTNDYELLHSDMRGEINNYRWQRDLQKRNITNGNIDDSRPDDNWGGNSNTLFKNP